jgi:hypothetical protein
LTNIKNKTPGIERDQQELALGVDRWVVAGFASDRAPE